MNGTIAVGVTDAPGAQSALHWAIERAIARRDRLRLVGVVGSAWGIVGEEMLVGDAISRTTALLEEAAASARAAGADAEILVERGDPVARLIDVSGRVDLLVLGSDFVHDGPRLRGVRGVRIAAGAHCPVVIVPETARGIARASSSGSTARRRRRRRSRSPRRRRTARETV